jgi:hypothetical protein
VGIVAAASLGAACGFRSDPFNGGLICTEPLDTEGPQAGSCESPFALPGGSMTVSGSLDGCSDAEGWCDASGAEHYYKYTPGEGDVTITFTPQEGGVDPILRVIRIPTGESPCGYETVEEDTEVCVPMIDGRNKQSFYADPGWDYYIAVDSARGTSGAYQFQVDYGPDAVGDTCKEEALREETIVLGRGGVFTWESTFPEGQGQVDGRWGGPGFEHIFVVNLIEGGDVSANIKAINDDFEPAISLRRGTGCAGSDAQSGGGGPEQTEASLSQSFSSAATRFLVLDNRGVSQGSYLMQIRLD